MYVSCNAFSLISRTQILRQGDLPVQPAPPVGLPGVLHQGDRDGASGDIPLLDVFGQLAGLHGKRQGI